MGLHSKLLLPEALCRVSFIWSCTSQIKKKLITFTDGFPIQGKCQKDTWQPEHLWKRAQHGEHDGFTDGYMCREMMEKPSQMSLYRFIFTDKTICVCVLKWPQMKMLPFGSECFYLLDGSKTGTSVFFRWNQTLNCGREASQGDE